MAIDKSFQFTDSDSLKTKNSELQICAGKIN